MQIRFCGYTLVFVLMLLLLAVALAGCSTITGVTETAAKRIGEGVRTYCEETIPDVRATFRAKVNEYATPHTVSVNCAQGTELTTLPEAESR